MESQYGMGLGGDLRHYIDGRPLFPAISPPPDHLHRPLSNPYDMLIFRSDTLADAGGASIDGGGGAGRWPRQETLTLLDIRSRLDPKFKEANHKGPLWDEVSRIMSQEHGYQRSGKKCREKFENLYKYYKKTKEGKAGRQDGKHYRFFRQLEALYGDTATSSATHLHGCAAANNTSTNFHYNNFPNTNDQEPYHPLSKISDISIPDSCDYDTTSSYCSDSNVAADGDDDARMKRRRGKGKSLKAKIEASIDAQMKTMMDKQQLWMEKMTTIIEGKEQDRLLREEQWRKQDAARIDGEQKMWAAERAWLESRDAALMEAFNKLAGKQHEPRAPPPPSGGVMWTDSDVTKLIQLKSGMELRFLENGMSEESAWDEIAAKMAVSGGGGGRSGSMCREKWDNLISDYLIKCGKKRKENAKGFTYSYDSISDDGVEGAMRRLNAGSSGDHVNDGIFRYFVGDSYQRL